MIIHAFVVGDKKSVLLFWYKLHIMKKVNVQENVLADAALQL